MNQVQLQKVNRMNSQWMPILLLRALGYSSLVAAIFSMALQWYYKRQQKQESTKEDQVTVYNTKPTKLQISTTSLRRSSSTFSNLSSSRQLMTPPPSPLSNSLDSSSPKTAASRSRPTSPLSNWSSRLIDGVMSSSIMNNIMKRKKLTISLKNTVLWNPSSDVNTPNHAFHEDAALFLAKLATQYDIYVIIHMNSTQERYQIQQLLNNNTHRLLDPHLIDERKILYCHSEQGKVHLIRHISPSIHIEGGWEMGNGYPVIQELAHSLVPRLVWVLPADAHLHYQKEEHYNNKVEFADHILHTSLAKQAGFDA